MGKYNKEWNGSYVAHICRGCGKMFVAPDRTNVKNTPPKWAFCEDCCKERGIDYDKQRPKDYRTEEEQRRIEEQTKKFLEARRKKMENKK